MISNSNQKSKKILIDARMYGTGNAGIGRSIEELVRGLVALDGSLTPQPPLSGGLCAFPPDKGGKGGFYEYYLFLTKENFDQVDFLPANWHKILVDVRWYTLKEQLVIPREIKKIKPDLVYFPHFNVPILYRGKFVVTIHDLIWLKYPRPRQEISTLGPVLYGIKNLFSKIIFRSAVKRAQKLAVPTEFTKKDLVGFYKLDLDKIKVINWGIGCHKNTKAQKHENKNNADNILKKCYNISEPYLLYVGSAYPHKNLEFLIKVFKECELDIQLVLAGKESYFYQKSKKLVQKLGIEDKVILTGYVDDYHLNLLYQNALAFVFPSLIEGFGFPPLEAMINKVPVLSSKDTCLPEILGEGALYFNSQNKEDLKEKILSIVSDSSLRFRLIEKGLEQVKKYDWETCAKEYWSFLSNK